ncbi:MAG: ABC transporter ATP-binding protein [Lachnospiraceae bacterium]|nr:ABC transporter ATP-binding protein [Lachnospiraceae bacterium]
MKTQTNDNLKHKLYERNHILFVLTILILVIQACLLTGVAIVLQQILDIAVSGTTEDVKKLLIIVAVYSMILAAGWLIERYVKNTFLEKALRQLKKELFVRLTGKNISSFTKESTGSYLSVFTNDIISIENNYLQNIFGIILNCFYFLTAIIIMLWYDPLLTICAIGMLIVSFVISIVFGSKLTKEEKIVSDQNENFVSLLKDLLSGFPVMKSFQAEPELTTLFANANQTLEHKKCHRRKTEGLINLVGNTCGLVVQAGVMLLGAYFTIEGRITAGVLIAFVQLMNYLIMPVQQIPPALANKKAAEGLLSKMENLLSANQSTEQGVALSNLNKGIRFENVSFGYEDGQTLLDNVNLHFEHGKSYAIVGASGSGKSTILNLLLGGYPQYSGKIMMGDSELKEISSESLYQHMAVVQQNVYIYNHTIENNITMFRNYPSKHLQTVLEKAGLTKLVAEKGLSYPCGENGSGLSGGEKQRISIARSLLRNPHILLMDEATSALDAENTACIEQMITQAQNMTRIVVTHKLTPSTLKQYDRIIVLQNGRIAGNGTYTELEETCDCFRQLILA